MAALAQWIATLAILIAALVAQCSAASSSRLYVSFHGGKSGINNVYQYDLQGNLLQSGILNGGDPEGLRSMAFGSNDDTSKLYICNSHDANPRVLLYGACASDGSRAYVGDFATTGLQHPYGLVWTSGNNGSELFVSSQNANTVSVYSSTGSYQGSPIDIDPQQIRGLAFDSRRGILYYANKDANQLVAYNIEQGQVDPALSFPVADPISALIDPLTYTIFISSAGSNVVLHYDLNSRVLLQNLTDASIAHPAGSALVGSTLYVVDQTALSVVQFDVSTGKFLGPLISNLPDSPEQILATPC